MLEKQLGDAAPFYLRSVQMLRVLLIAASLAAASMASTANAADRVALVKPQKNASFTTILREAERGNARYATYLGYMYEIGRGVPQDYHLAAHWYRVAAELGDVRAQHLLGLLYDRGQGVRLDPIEAHKWLNLAAARAGDRDRDYFVRIRNAVASKLSKGEIYAAQRRAQVWVAGRE